MARLRNSGKSIHRDFSRRGAMLCCPGVWRGRARQASRRAAYGELPPTLQAGWFSGTRV